ncbi:hypothetical protein ACE6H2_006524 [Prunus campanulata]
MINSLPFIILSNIHTNYMPYLVSLILQEVYAYCHVIGSLFNFENVNTICDLSMQLTNR